ncbi:MAG: DUF655 domain-containing protein [Candidatus Micrarchaeia archaeon]|jgi:putative nucleotide binding protein
MEENEELEEYAYVLDFLPTGKSSSLRSEPIVQLVGESKFTLLEAVTKTKEIRIGERVYIGRGERDKIQQIKGRITYEELTETAKGELPVQVANIIKQNEAKFVKLFNTAGPLNMRLHSLELLPGIGKKHLEAILQAREEKPFESFQDLASRVPLLQDPVKLLTERVIEELKGGSRFYILTRPYRT